MSDRVAPTKPQPPAGIKYKHWARKKASSEHSSKPNNGGWFVVSCPSNECRLRSNPDPDSTSRPQGFASGIKPPKQCPACGTPIDVRGYVR